MGLFDGLEVTIVAKGERTNQKDPKGRLLDAIDRQIQVANGKTVKVAGNNLSSWLGKDGGETVIKVSDIILFRLSNNITDWKHFLKTMKENVESGAADDVIKAFTEALEKKAAAKKKLAEEKKAGFILKKSLT
jgi:predicted nucleotide-binding protein (sugar kinase/HSP70/actin superfamily)